MQVGDDRPEDIGTRHRLQVDHHGVVVQVQRAERARSTDEALRRLVDRVGAQAERVADRGAFRSGHGFRAPKEPGGAAGKRTSRPGQCRNLARRRDDNGGSEAGQGVRHVIGRHAERQVEECEAPATCVAVELAVRAQHEHDARAGQEDVGGEQPGPDLPDIACALLGGGEEQPAIAAGAGRETGGDAVSHHAGPAGLGLICGRDRLAVPDAGRVPQPHIAAHGGGIDWFDMSRCRRRRMPSQRGCPRQRRPHAVP